MNYIEFQGRGEQQTVETAKLHCVASTGGALAAQRQQSGLSDSHHFLPLTAPTHSSSSSFSPWSSSSCSFPLGVVEGVDGVTVVLVDEEIQVIGDCLYLYVSIHMLINSRKVWHACWAPT